MRHIRPLCLRPGRADVFETLDFVKQAPDCSFATQSGPMLVIDGDLHPRFLPDSTSRFIRNGVGTSADGSKAIFVISNNTVTFHEFGHFWVARRLGVKVLYECEVTELQVANGRFESATVSSGDGKRTICARAVVVASGGFQSNEEWMREAWGEAADNFRIRGTPHNRGIVLKNLMENGVTTVGDPTQCHAVAIDARAGTQIGDGVQQRR